MFKLSGIYPAMLTPLHNDATVNEGELRRLVDSGRAVVAFALYPTSIEELMLVADANEIMPPKSTWFEPKLRDGMVIHTLE